MDSIARIFKNKSTVLTDPDPKLTPDEVRLFYTDVYPELTNSKVVANGYDDEMNQQFEFITKTGTNG